MLEERNEWTSQVLGQPPDLLIYPAVEVDIPTASFIRSSGKGDDSVDVVWVEFHQLGNILL
jgi:hypothetical protein